MTYIETLEEHVCRHAKEYGDREALRYGLTDWPPELHAEAFGATCDHFHVSEADRDELRTRLFPNGFPKRGKE